MCDPLWLLFHCRPQLSYTCRPPEGRRHSADLPLGSTRFHFTSKSLLVVLWAETFLSTSTNKRNSWVMESLRQKCGESSDKLSISGEVPPVSSCAQHKVNQLLWKCVFFKKKIKLFSSWLLTLLELIWSAWWWFMTWWRLPRSLINEFNRNVLPSSIRAFCLLRR